MSELISLLWGIVGFIFIAAGKDFMYVFACFLLCGVFLGTAELRDIKKELGGGFKGTINFEGFEKTPGEDKDD